MTGSTPAIQFFDGISEVLDDVSLRQERSTGTKIVQFTFRQLKAIDRFNSFTKNFSNAMLLRDEEGDISVEPSSVKFFFAGPEGDDLEKVECKFEVIQDDHWQRFMRFMHRYAEANGMAYANKNANAANP